MSEKLHIIETAAGHMCSGCKRGFCCWHGPDESPCGHDFSEFALVDLRKYLKQVPENKAVREFLEKNTNTQTVTLEVQFKVKIPKDVDPNIVTFEIPIEQIRVDGDRQDIGTVLSYCTQEYVG